MNRNTEKRADNAYLVFRRITHLASVDEILPARLPLMVKTSIEDRD